MLRLGLLATLVLLSASPGAVADDGEATTQVVLEEVVAVVGHTPILRSDLELAALVQLGTEAGEESEASFESRLLDLRIRLELQFRDLESSGILYRLQPQVEVVVEDLVANGGGRQELEQGMALLGLSWTDLEDLALRIAATQAYVKQRLRPQLSVSVEEIEEAYQELAQETRQRGYQAPPLAELEEQLHRLVAERKLNREIEQWLEQARERLEVSRFAP